MRFYVFKKNNDLSSHPDWFEPVITKKIYSTTEFDLAQIRYNSMELELKSTEVLFMVADFGIAEEKKKFQNTYINSDNKYFPFFVVRCSDDSYFNYEEKHNMKNVQIVLINDGIHQCYFNPVSAFEKYEYYKNNRIACILAIGYIDKEGCNNTIPVSSIQHILWNEHVNYIKRLGFEPVPNSITFGPIVIKKRVEC